jgi:hypothetical protein
MAWPYVYALLALRRMSSSAALCVGFAEWWTGPVALRSRPGICLTGPRRRVAASDIENPAHKEPGGIQAENNTLTAQQLPLGGLKLPASRTAVRASGVSELIALQIGYRQPGPPVPASARRRCPAQVAR